ncbi:MAG: endonuclease [Bacteroidota bacterium]
MRIKLLIILFFTSSLLVAQIPDYYNDVNLNLTGQSLKNELANKVTSTHTTFISYTPGVWDALKQADLVPGSTSRVILIYGYNDNDGTLNTDRTRGVNDNGGGSNDWNREHVYPRSLGTPNLGSSGPGSDAHHLRPADVSRNSSRGNRKFADGSGNSGTTSQGYWYPGDEFKGDVARMMMYMYIRYGNRCLPVNVGVGSSPANDSDMLNLFLEWNAEDPVSALEIQRNPILEGIQGNRNPFIDNPAFATEIWGGPQAEDRFGSGGGNPGGGSFCSSAVSTFPYDESFESGFGGWIQSTSDDFDWTRRSGSTPSSNTGPSAASDGTVYAYMESSTPNFSTKRSILQSPCYDLSEEIQANFTFKYHMYGSSNMGSLRLEATTDGSNWSTIWSKSGNQGNSWQTASVNLSSYLGVTFQLRFNGVTGTTWQGDMAIDDVAINTGGSSGGGPTETDLVLSIALDNYPEETSWEIRNSNNTIVESGGTYGSQPDGSQVNISMSLPTGCYNLIFRDTYGDGICCAYGSGSYSLNVVSDGTVLASGGQFGSSETKSFCVGSGSARTASAQIVVDENSIERKAFYPNPATEFIEVSSRKDTFYKIMTYSGKIIRKGKTTGRIDIKELNTGIYILQLSDGKTTFSGRLIKQ